MKVLGSVLVMMFILLFGISCSDDKRGNEDSLGENTYEAKDLGSGDDNALNKKVVSLYENTDDFNILLFISLGLNIITLICVFAIYRKQVKQQREFRNQTVDIVSNSKRISDNIEQKVSLAANKRMLSESNKSSNLSNTDKEFIIGEVQKLIRLDICEIIDEEFRKKNHPNSISRNNDNKKVEFPQREERLYASSVDKNSHAFYSVSTQPQEDTIYLLIIDIYNKNNASFEIFKGAFSKILEVPDFLEDASEYQILGSQTVLTEEKGLAEKQVDGKWKVVLKAKVKFK